MMVMAYIFMKGALHILMSLHIKYFILKVVDSVHCHPNGNVPNLNLKNVYGKKTTNWTRKHGTLNFMPPHTNYVLIETWEYFKLSSVTITQKYFKKTHIIPLSLLYIGNSPSLSCRYSTFKHR